MDFYRDTIVGIASGEALIAFNFQMGPSFDPY